MPLDHFGNDQMSFVEAPSRVWLTQAFFLNLQSLLKKFLAQAISVWRLWSNSLVRLWCVWLAHLADPTALEASESSLSHQGFDWAVGLCSDAVWAMVFWMASESVSAYVSSWSFEGDLLERRGVSVCSALVSSSSSVLDHSSGSTFFVLNLMGKKSGMSLRPWSMVKVMVLWSESKERLGSTAQYLKVSWLTASGLVKDRSMTEGRSPVCLARWVISPLLLRRE